MCQKFQQMFSGIRDFSKFRDYSPRDSVFLPSGYPGDFDSSAFNPQIQKNVRLTLIYLEKKFRVKRTVLGFQNLIYFVNFIFSNLVEQSVEPELYSQNSQKCLKVII